MPGDVAGPGVGPSAADVFVPGEPGAGVGLRLGEGRPAGGLDGAIEGAPDVAEVLSPRATVEARARCVPPEISSAAIPPATTASATAATAAATRGRCRTPCHHCGPGAMTGFGNPAGPNAPARCVTLARCARPVGVLSAPACSTRSRRLPGGLISSAAPSAPTPAGATPAAATPLVPRRRMHSLRA